MSNPHVDEETYDTYSGGYLYPMSSDTSQGAFTSRPSKKDAAAATAAAKEAAEYAQRLFDQATSSHPVNFATATPFELSMKYLVASYQPKKFIYSDDI